MTNRLEIQPRNVYGEIKIYPICPKAREFASVAGTKTLTLHTLACALRLGFTLVELDRYGQVCREHAFGATFPNLLSIGA